MSVNASAVTPISTEIKPSKKKQKTPIDVIKSRRSNELVIALCGAVGSGIPSLRKTLMKQLGENGYHVEHIRLSDLIIAHSEDENVSELVGFKRYEKLQDLGDKLRDRYRESIVTELAIRQITILREAKFGKSKADGAALKVTNKIAYIIDQVKHPKEIRILKEAYANNFYLLGLLRTEDERRRILKGETMKENEASSLIERDRKDSDDFGQQVENSLHKADYFIRNIDVAEKLTHSVGRFIKLVHGSSRITPTKDETGMFSAHSASLRSACLSRQVGATITDDDGLVLSTGCNDVPKFGGGLYNSEVLEDKRCFNQGGYCHNDKHKELLRKEIESILKSSNVNEPKELAEKIIKNSKAKSLIEYSRAIHAEMDAITAISRSTGSSTVGKTLYCTTYPCHICARHIVAAGIKRVVYIEPYEKSLALQLHSDAISHPGRGKDNNTVLFENFEGVSPLRYSKFFGFSQKRKDEKGEVIIYSVTDSEHVDPQYLDSYLEYELKIVEMVRDDFPDPV